MEGIKRIFYSIQILYLNFTDNEEEIKLLWALREEQVDGEFD